jgi:hypothetical protein
MRRAKAPGPGPVARYPQQAARLPPRVLSTSAKR